MLDGNELHFDNPVTFLIGENGSGKTTLMKALLGLMKIHSGSITFGDGLTQTQIGYMPQRTDIQKDFPKYQYHSTTQAYG